MSNVGELLVSGVSTDSRNIQPGDLFVALKGERFDGHDFAIKAAAQGAAALLLEEDKAQGICEALKHEASPSPKQAVIAVEDTLSALQAMAGSYRNMFTLPVIAVTGSTGKTTTKDMIAAICSNRGPVLKSWANFNNEIGLPLTLLKLNSHHRTMVVEMGMRGLGQIRTLAKIAQPSVGVITNVGAVHMELLGSQSAIQTAKRELVETMAPGSLAVLNADDPLVRDMAEACFDKEVIFYGWQSKPSWNECGSETAYLAATDVVTRGAEGISFRLHWGGRSAAIELPVPGIYQVSNALAAAAAALGVGASLDDIQVGLAGVKLSDMRMELIPWLENGLVINDAYNANPTSMVAALQTAHEIAAGRPLVLVLGDMLELGPLSESAHYEIGRKAATYNPVYLITVGPMAKDIAEGARDEGMDPALVVECKDREVASRMALQLAKPGDVVLVKASRGLALEHVVRALDTM